MLARPVLVVIGAGGMGMAMVRRLGSGCQVVIADFSEKTLAEAANILKGEGHYPIAHSVDVSNLASVRELASQATALGALAAVIHTAGLSPLHATADQIYAVDLIGTANVIEAFENVVSTGTSVVCIASMAGYSAPLDPEVQEALAIGATESLLTIPLVVETTDPGMAYVVSKRGNQLRVQARATAYGKRGARLNSISPGIISTPMGQGELAGPMGAYMRGMIEASGSGRVGTPDDIALAAAFLVGPTSTFVHGIDLCVDGGVTATRWA